MLFQFFIIILNKIPCLLVIFLQAYYVKSLHSMLGVGFEPTRANTRDLKSPPLDQLGHPGKEKIKNSHQAVK